MDADGGAGSPSAATIPSPRPRPCSPALISRTSSSSGARRGTTIIRGLLVPEDGQGRFRPEIQGLRALAVALVVLYHLAPQRISGGYVGVDVFFVISGFLISSHLLREVESTGRVRIAQFWARRARRLLPASFLVLLVTLVLTATVLPPSVRLANFREIGASAVYLQNWLLATDSVDYLAAGNTPSLVQHFWSLSTEEQFYLIWPVLIAATVVFARRRRSIGVLLAVVTASSLLISTLMVSAAPGPAYFVTPSRAWEFAAGGLLAFAPGIRSPHVRVVVGWAGLLAIGVTAAAYTASTPFPGLAALLPVLGTCAVIVAGSPSSRAAWSTIARVRPVQYLGGISYSVYLWHFPLIQVYVTTRGHGPSLAGMFAILAATAGLAALTKRVVEDRFRGASSRSSNRSTFGLTAAAMAVVLLGASGATVLVQRENQHQAVVALQRIQGGDPCYAVAATIRSHRCTMPFALPAGFDTAAMAADSTHDWCLEPYSGTTVRTCDFGDAQAPVRRVALLGDSHANVLIDGLQLAAQARGWRISTFVKEGCPAVPTPPLPGSLSASDAADCSMWTTQAVDRILADDGIDTVLFTNASNSRAYYAGVTEGQYASMFSGFVAAGKRVVVMYDVPKPPEAGPACIDRWRTTGAACEVPREQAIAAGAALRRAAASVPGVETLDPADFFCDQQCHAVVGGVGAYFDVDHITRSISMSLAPFLEKALVHAPRSS